VRAKDLKSPGGLLNDMFTKKINEYFIRIITSFHNPGIQNKKPCCLRNKAIESLNTS